MAPCIRRGQGMSAFKADRMRLLSMEERTKRLNSHLSSITLSKGPLQIKPSPEEQTVASGTAEYGFDRNNKFGLIPKKEKETPTIKATRQVYPNSLNIIDKCHHSLIKNNYGQQLWQVEEKANRFSVGAGFIKAPANTQRFWCVEK